MPRKPREYYLSDFYHVMIQGDEKKFIFKKENFKEKIIDLIKKNAIRNNIKLIAYCIMDNHVHILVYCKKLEELSKMMLQCNTSFGRYYSKNRGVVGHVFRDRYRSEPIFSKDHLINCIKYIHENPVKSEKVKSCREYYYSSYREYVNKTGVFDEELQELCDIEVDDYLSIINKTKTDSIYIDEVEDSEKFFEEIKNDFNLKSITDEGVVVLYDNLIKRCKITKTQFAELLGIDRKKVSRILCKAGYGCKR